MTEFQQTDLYKRERLAGNHGMNTNLGLPSLGTVERPKYGRVVVKVVPDWAKIQELGVVKSLFEVSQNAITWVIEGVAGQEGLWAFRQGKRFLQIVIDIKRPQSTDRLDALESRVSIAMKSQSHHSRHQEFCARLRNCADMCRLDAAGFNAQLFSESNYMRHYLADLRSENPLLCAEISPFVLYVHLSSLKILGLEEELEEQLQRWTEFFETLQNANFTKAREMFCQIEHKYDADITGHKKRLESATLHDSYWGASVKATVNVHHKSVFSDNHSSQMTMHAGSKCVFNKTKSTDSGTNADLPTAEQLITSEYLGPVCEDARKTALGWIQDSKLFIQHFRQHQAWGLARQRALRRCAFEWAEACL